MKVLKGCNCISNCACETKSSFLFDFMLEKKANICHMEVVTVERKAKKSACECKLHRLDSAGEDGVQTHTKDIGHSPERIRDKDIKESFSSVSFGLFSL